MTHRGSMTQGTSRIMTSPQNKSSWTDGKYGSQSLAREDASLRTNQGLRYMANQQQRVADALNKNSVMDSSPTALHTGHTPHSILKLRERDKTKDIGPEFHFRPNMYFEKFTDKLVLRNAPYCSIKNKEIYASKILNKRGDIKRNIRAYNTNEDVNSFIKTL